MPALPELDTILRITGESPSGSGRSSVMVQEAQVNAKNVCDAGSVTLPLDKFPHVEFSVTGHGHNCSECRKPCEGEKLTCSDKCRKRRNRRQRDARTAIHLVMFELGKIRDSLKRRETTPRFIADLNRLKAEINDLLLMAGDADAVQRHSMLTEVSRKRSL